VLGVEDLRCCLANIGTLALPLLLLVLLAIPFPISTAILPTRVWDCILIPNSGKELALTKFGVSLLPPHWQQFRKFSEVRHVIAKLVACVIALASLEVLVVIHDLTDAGDVVSNYDVSNLSLRLLCLGKVDIAEQLEDLKISRSEVMSFFRFLISARLVVSCVKSKYC
jgi:hypothetical protein